MKEKQIQFIEMINDFSNLTKEKQIYAAGVIAGLALQKEMKEGVKN